MIKEIAIENLLPNPFRKIENYPIVRQVVEELKKSMEETGVWVGIVARKAELNGKYEIAFGHHRLAAMKELDVKEAPVDVQKIDDLRMVQQMAFENMSARKTNTQVITETVLSAREQLKKVLDDWRWMSGTSISRLFESEMGWKTWTTRDEGIGNKILIRFLGSHWETNIAKALKLIAKADEGKLDLKAAEKFDSPSQAVAFSELVEEKEIEVEKQEEYADEVIHHIQRVFSKEEEPDPEDQGELTVSRIMGYGKYDESNHIFRSSKERLRWEINEAIENYTRDLTLMNNGIPVILETWEEITESNQRAFVIAAKNFIQIIQEGVKPWKKMLE